MIVTQVGKAVQVLLSEDDAVEIAAALYWADWALHPKARELFGKIDDVAEVSL